MNGIPCLWTEFHVTDGIIAILLLPLTYEWKKAMRQKLILSDSMPVARFGNSPLQPIGSHNRKQEGKSIFCTEYETETDSSQALGICVKRVGQKSDKPLFSEESRIHHKRVSDGGMMEEGFRTTDYRLIYITQGEGEITFHSNEPGSLVKGGYLIWLLPGQWYAYTRNKSLGWNEYAINFNGDLIRSLVQGSPLEQRSGIFEVGYNNDWVNLYIQAIETARRKKIGFQSHLSGILFHLLGNVLSVLKEREGCVDVMRQKMEQAKILMNENLRSNIDMPRLASMVGLSYSWFRKTFKEYMGIAPARYFSELKIEKVKQMLDNDPTLSIKELIYAFGYTSPDNFYDCFKRYTGYAPGQYRKMAMEKKSA